MISQLQNCFVRARGDRAGFVGPRRIKMPHCFYFEVRERSRD